MFWKIIRLWPHLTLIVLKNYIRNLKNKIICVHAARLNFDSIFKISLTANKILSWQFEKNCFEKLIYEL